MEDEDTIVALGEQRGNIGLFAPHLSSPGLAFLHGAAATEADCQQLDRSIKTLPTYRLAMQQPRTGVPLPIDGWAYYPPDRVGLSPKQCTALVRHLEDERQRRGGAALTDIDVRIEVTADQLTRLLDSDTTVLPRLLALFGERATRMVLRRVAASGLCIRFHTDVSRRVMQVPLTDDTAYEGARLTFLSASTGRLSVPPRPMGSATVHDHSVVHGVTVMTAGVRYGLFLLHEVEDAESESDRETRAVAP
jgi:hypothetical protein